MVNRSHQQRDALTKAISRVLYPVMICMALAVWFVHSLGDPGSCKEDEPQVLDEVALIKEDDRSFNRGTSSYSTTAAAIFVGVFCVLMVVFTFLIVWLYKTGRQKIIKGWLLIAVFVIFAYVGGLYIFDFCRSHCIDLDWITLSLAVWNFTVVGLFAVFGIVPRLVNQAYLIVMSALMAYIFRTLPAWSIWTILGVLVVWDIFAVLYKYGPLRMLVEAARETGAELPALVYDTNPNPVGREKNPSSSRSKAKSSAKKEDTSPPLEDGARPAPATTTESTVPVRKRRGLAGLFGKKAAAPTADSAEEATPESGDQDALAKSSAQDEDSTKDKEKSSNPEEPRPIGTLGTHLKLGLGDFVFYSILVAEASKSGAMTAVTSFVAILAGLCATLFMVFVYRKALPALPVSITAGLLFFFLTRYTIQPFVSNISPEMLFH